MSIKQLGLSLKFLILKVFKRPVLIIETHEQEGGAVVFVHS